MVIAKLQVAVGRAAEMGSYFAYTPSIWPMLAAAAAAAVLAVYVWRHSSSPPARPLAVMAILGVPWAVGAALEAAAVDTAVSVFWFKFHTVWELPTATAALWFALEYADFGRWINRRTLAILAIPPLVAAVAIMADGSYHTMWARVWFHGRVGADPTTFNVLLHGYGLLISIGTALLFLWVLLSSPLHRWSAALCLGAQVLARGGHMLDRTHPGIHILLARLPGSLATSPLATVDLPVLMFPVVAGLYGVALLRFRLFDVLPVARSNIIERMKEGMLVLSETQEVLDINPAAERMLGLSAAAAKGKPLSQICPECAQLGVTGGWNESEVCVQKNAAASRYEVHHSSLARGRGTRVGSLLLLYDVSQQRQTQEQLIEQQRAVATLQERDRVARELHDSLGQVLGYVKMQAQAAREHLSEARWAEAADCLDQLTSVVQDAHQDVRDYILGARVGIHALTNFIPTLAQYLRRFSLTSGVSVTLEIAPELRAQAFDPTVASQLLRIIQEALTNVRKHARAREAKVRLQMSGEECVEAIVEDNGSGFDPARLERAEDPGFGLRLMRERAAEIGARVCVQSAPGHGAEVIVSVPFRKVCHAGSAG